jgi:hypothetical protein
MRLLSQCPPILFLFLSSFAIADFSLSALCTCHLSLSVSSVFSSCSFFELSAL